MANFRPQSLAQYDGYNIETQRLIFDSIGFEEYPCGPIHFPALFSIDGCMCNSYGFIAAGLDFNKYKSSTGICEDEIYFAIGATVVAGDCFIAFGIEIFLAAFLTPPAELLRISQQLSPVEREDEHREAPLLGYSMIAVPLCEPDALTTSLSEKIEFGTSGLAATDSPYVDDIGRMEREDTFDTFVTENAANRESLVDAATSTANDGTAEDLDTGLVAFADTTLNIHNVTNFKIRNLILEALTLD